MAVKWLMAGLLWLLLVPQALAGTLLVVGDSISAAFGLETRQGWVHLLEQRLREQAPHWQVVNASRSGETSGGGRSRLPGLLTRHAPQLVLIELGGNDGLRGQPLEQLQRNLAGMVEQARTAGAQVVLLGMQLPPNYGQRYTAGFAAVFAEVARAQQVPLVPFFLEGVGGNPALMQADGIHPNAAAQPYLLENAWPVLAPLL
ncbi:arylesterase [Pseudomonas sp. NW5]|uniref:arylesterase n=1 Tax=Pseudomonas sp. NW5 TaxID=2934934 RepID=UPI0020205572|nr:arylesterase [Pseudomonas sp. NW5]MCL7462589.1 arylesterase [Pseudomonas sp. NW5]